MEISRADLSMTYSVCNNLPFFASLGDIEAISEAFNHIHRKTGWDAMHMACAFAKFCNDSASLAHLDIEGDAVVDTSFNLTALEENADHDITHANVSSIKGQRQCEEQEDKSETKRNNLQDLSMKNYKKKGRPLGPCKCATITTFDELPQGYVTLSSLNLKAIEVLRKDDVFFHYGFGSRGKNVRPAWVKFRCVEIYQHPDLVTRVSVVSYSDSKESSAGTIGCCHIDNFVAISQDSIC